MDLVDVAGKGLADDVETLLERGADPAAPDASGLTPLEAARAAGFEEVARILIARGAPDATRPPEVIADALLAPRFAGRKPGLAVLVSRRWKILFEKGYGYADLALQVPVSPRTQFRIGSVSKQFAAAAILLLEQDGKLRVDDPLAKFLPDHPRGDEITLHHLLTHTAGIPNHTDAPDIRETITRPTTLDALIDSFGRELDFEPGESWSYSNSGYALLAAVVERASGRPYADFLQERIFDPLEMRDSGVHPRFVKPELEARGYAWENGAAADALDWDLSRVRGAGDLYSTVLDLHEWNQALFEGRVLPRASLERAFDGGAWSYGYGFQIGRHRGTRLIHHNGSMDGFMSFLYRFEEPGLTVALLHDARPPVAPLDDVPLKLGDLFLQDVLPPRPALRVDPDVDPGSYDAFVGRYRLPGGLLQTVSRKGDQLTSQISGQDAFPIFPSAPDRFFFKVVDAQLEFLRDGATVTAVRNQQNAATVIATRIDDPVEVEISPSSLRDFTGRYDYGSAVLTVTLEKSGLHAQLSGQPRFPIYPAGGDVFVWKVVEARITFVRNDQGTVTHGIHEQGGRVFTVAKLD